MSTSKTIEVKNGEGKIITGGDERLCAINLFEDFAVIISPEEQEKTGMIRGAAITSEQLKDFFERGFPEEKSFMVKIVGGYGKEGEGGEERLKKSEENLETILSNLKSIAGVGIDIVDFQALDITHFESICVSNRRAITMYQQKTLLQE